MQQQQRHGRSARPVPPLRWNGEAERRSFSVKLLQALHLLRATGAAAPDPARAVRVAAYRALARTARGRTRWSRALLSPRIRFWVSTTTTTKKRKRKETAMKNRIAARSLHSSVERRTRALGELVPGCRKLAFPALLEEAADYISALEMQVKAMAALSDLLAS